MKLPPYGWIDKEGIKRGIIYDLNQKIGIRSGLEFTNELYPFQRMLHELKSGRVDVLSSQAHQNALDSGEPLGITHFVNVIVATKKNSGIACLEDLQGKTLVYHQGASYRQLEGLPGRIVRVQSYEQSLKLLSSRDSLHGAVFSEIAYYYYMHKIGATPDNFGKVIYIERDKPQWIFVRRGLPPEIRNKLKKAVDAINMEDQWVKLQKNYGINTQAK